MNTRPEKAIYFKKRIMGASMLLIVTLILCATSYVTQSKDNSATEIQTAYYESYDYEYEADYEAAIDSLIQVYNDYPDTYTVNFRLGWLYYLAGDYEESIFHYQESMRILPSSMEAKTGCMLPMLAESKYNDVEKLAYQVLSEDDRNYYASLRLAYALRKQGKMDSAENLVNEMLTLYPTDVSFLTELGLLKTEQEDYESATSIFWNVLVLDPNNSVALGYFEE